MQDNNGLSLNPTNSAPVECPDGQVPSWPDHEPTDGSDPEAVCVPADSVDGPSDGAEPSPTAPLPTDASPTADAPQDEGQ